MPRRASLDSSLVLARLAQHLRERPTLLHVKREHNSPPNAPRRWARGSKSNRVRVRAPG
jgi:hypothetical protein